MQSMASVILLTGGFLSQYSAALSTISERLLPTGGGNESCTDWKISILQFDVSFDNDKEVFSTVNESRNVQ